MKILIFLTVVLFFSNGYSNNNFFDSVRSKFDKENNPYSIKVKPLDLEKKNKQETKNNKNLIIKNNNFLIIIWFREDPCSFVNPIQC